MIREITIDEGLIQRLPLPLAKLYRRAHNAKTASDRHFNAFSLWEASLKVLASVAVVEYAERPNPDPKLAQALQALARPSLGNWWQFIRLLVPVLAEQGQVPFVNIRDLLLGRAREDFPYAAGLDALLREQRAGGQQARVTVRFTELIDRLVHYRNNVLLGHGAPGALLESHCERMARALMAGAAELLSRLDVLAGRRLLYLAEARQSGGVWRMQRYELIGENPRRIEALDFPRDQTARLPDGERVYLEVPPDATGLAELRLMHPLLLYDAEAELILVLNSRRGRQRTEYLCYNTGRTVDRPDLGGEQRTLLGRVLGMTVEPLQMEQWQTCSQAEEPSEAVAAAIAEARTLGEFELLSELGRGGMGVVYRAWQPSLGRQVAVKKLLRTGDAGAEARFSREIQALARVEHPHLVKIFTSGAAGEDWFYAMELVEGAPLSTLCEKLQSASAVDVNLQTWQDVLTTACAEARQCEKPLSDTPRPPPAPAPATAPAFEPPTQVAPPPGRNYALHMAQLIQQVAEAVHALHEKGILHRDIKPSNIIVSADGSNAVLMDLGLAQLADADRRLTQTRQFVGTLRYASPQQVLAVGQLDRRSDVYSLGATLWELLALRPLFGATDQMPSPVLMEKIQREEPDRLRRCRPNIPRDLEAIVHKCLEKNPHQRYETARELARDLRRFVAGKPVQARPVRSIERAAKWIKRHPAVAGLYGSIALVMVLGALLVWLAWRDPKDAHAEPPRLPPQPDLFDTAKRVKFGHAGFLVHDGEIQNDALVTMFQFKAPTAGTAEVLLDPAADSKLDGRLYAYDAERTTLRENDGEALRRVGQIFFPVKADHDYFVKVAACDATIGKYKLTFKHIKGPGSAFHNAQELRLSSAGLGTQTWGFEGDGEEHYFRLTSRRPGLMHAGINKGLGSPFDAMLTLFDDACKPVVGPPTRFFMKPDKTYYLKTKALRTPGLGMVRGDYTLVCNLIETSTNNDFASAKLVTLDGLGSATIQGHIVNEVDMNYFVFQATKTGAMKVDLIYPSGSQLEARAEALDGARKSIGNGASFAVTSGQTYYLNVTPSNGRQRAGPYVLRLSTNAGVGGNLLPLRQNLLDQRRLVKRVNNGTDDCRLSDLTMVFTPELMPNPGKTKAAFDLTRTK